MDTEWHDRDGYQLAMSSEAISSALATLPGTVKMRYLVDFSDSLHIALNSPCIEFSIAYFDAGVADTARSLFQSTAVTFMDKVAAHPQSSRGFASGWALHDVAIPQKNGENGKGFVSAAGWDSMEAHYVFNTTDIFHENFGDVATGAVIGWDIFHFKAIKA
ncbi:hypothetical protein MMC10_004157 [Thelotrema lepadinum]|nr:hypothetical protein [Thelotrema lepadinum]